MVRFLLGLVLLVLDAGVLGDSDCELAWKLSLRSTAGAGVIGDSDDALAWKLSLRDSAGPGVLGDSDGGLAWELSLSGSADAGVLGASGGGLGDSTCENSILLFLILNTRFQRDIIA